MLPATEVMFPEEEPDDCCNYDFDQDRRTAPGVCCHGYVPLSHSGTRRYENWTNSNYMCISLNFHLTCGIALLTL